MENIKKPKSRAKQIKEIVQRIPRVGRLVGGVLYPDDTPIQVRVESRRETNEQRMRRMMQQHVYDMQTDQEYADETDFEDDNDLNILYPAEQAGQAMDMIDVVISQKQLEERKEENSKANKQNAGATVSGHDEPSDTPPPAHSQEGLSSPSPDA
jgi:hypothetical protein